MNPYENYRTCPCPQCSKRREEECYKQFLRYEYKQLPPIEISPPITEECYTQFLRYGYKESKDINNNNQNNMNNIFKKLTDSKVKALVKAGFLASDLSLTIKGFESLKEILFLANYDEMVKKAEEFNKENEKNQK